MRKVCKKMAYENDVFVIQSGKPNFLHGGAGGRGRKDNELIRTLKRLNVDQYIHIPASKEKYKQASDVAKKNIAVVKNQMKNINPNLQFSYGAAVEQGVYGVCIQRREDKQPSVKNRLVF
jgi:hypothetical protein